MDGRRGWLARWLAGLPAEPPPHGWRSSVVLCCVVLFCVVLFLAWFECYVTAWRIGLLKSITNYGVQRCCHTHVLHIAYSSQFALCRWVRASALKCGLLQSLTNKHTSQGPYLVVQKKLYDQVMQYSVDNL